MTHANIVLSITFRKGGKKKRTAIQDKDPSNPKSHVLHWLIIDNWRRGRK